MKVSWNIRLQNLIKAFGFTVMPFILSGCLVSLRTPSLRFLSPEAKGKAGHGEAFASLQSTQRAVLIPETTDTPPTMNQPRNNKTEVLFGVNAAVGVWRLIDVYARLPNVFFENTPVVGGLKFQFIGAPESEEKMGNFSVSLIAGGGWAQDSDHDTAEVAPSSDAFHKVHTAVLESGLLAGYRVNENFLGYFGSFFTEYLSSGYVKQGTTKYNYDQSAHQIASNLGIQINFAAFLARLELGMSSSRWNSRWAHDPLMGIAVGGRW